MSDQVPISACQRDNDKESVRKLVVRPIGDDENRAATLSGTAALFMTNDGIEKCVPHLAGLRF